MKPKPPRGCHIIYDDRLCSVCDRGCNCRGLGDFVVLTAWTNAGLIDIAGSCTCGARTRQRVPEKPNWPIIELHIRVNPADHIVEQISAHHHDVCPPKSRSLQWDTNTFYCVLQNCASNVRGIFASEYCLDGYIPHFLNDIAGHWHSLLAFITNQRLVWLTCKHV